MKKLKNYQKEVSNVISAINKKFTALCVFLCICFMGVAQSPEAFNYQAVVRDAGGNIIASQAVGVQISILQNSASGTLVYRETFAPTSNAYGLVNLQIGTGTVSSGVFANINWGSGPYFIEVGLDPAGGTSYTVSGTSELVSVPYALYAANSGDSKWQDGTNTGIGYFGGTVGIGTLDALPTTQLLVAHVEPNDISNIRISNESALGLAKMTINNDILNTMVIGINGSTSNFGGANEAFFWYFNDADMKFATNSTERVRIKNTGNIEIKTGDVSIENIGSGVITRSPDGNCWRITVSNAGALVLTAITCP